MEKQEFITIMVENGVIGKTTVKGENVKLDADNEKQFFSHLFRGRYYIVEKATGCSVANAKNRFKAIKIANKKIELAKKKGVYSKKLLKISDKLFQNGIITPINIIYKKKNVPQISGSPEKVAVLSI